MKRPTKLEAIKDKQYAQDYLLIASLTYHWRKLKPDSDELKALGLSIADIQTYVSGLQADRAAMLQVIEDLEKENELLKQSKDE